MDRYQRGWYRLLDLIGANRAERLAARLACDGKGVVFSLQYIERLRQTKRAARGTNQS